MENLYILSKLGCEPVIKETKTMYITGREAWRKKDMHLVGYKPERFDSFGCPIGTVLDEIGYKRYIKQISVNNEGRELRQYICNNIEKIKSIKNLRDIKTIMTQENQ